MRLLKNSLKSLVLFFSCIAYIAFPQEKTDQIVQEISLIESFVTGKFALKSGAIHYEHFYGATITFSGERKEVHSRLECIKNQASSCEKEILNSTDLVPHLLKVKDHESYDSAIKGIPLRLIFCIQAIRLQQFLADHSAPAGFRLAFDNRKKLFKALLTTNEDFNSLAKRYFAFASLKEYLLATAECLEKDHATKNSL